MQRKEKSREKLDGRIIESRCYGIAKDCTKFSEYRFRLKILQALRFYKYMLRILVQEKRKKF